MTTEPTSVHPALNYVQAQQAEERSRANGPWSVDHLRLCWVWLTIFAVPVSGLIAIFVGARAGAGAALGFAIVGLFFTLSTVAVAKVGQYLPEMVLAAALGAYLMKIVALGVVILVMPADGPFSQRWMAIAVVVGLIVWMAAHLRYITKAKFYYTDPTAT